MSLRSQLRSGLGIDTIEERVAALEELLEERDPAPFATAPWVAGAGDSILGIWEDGFDVVGVAPTYDPAADDYPLEIDVPEGRPSPTISGAGMTGVELGGGIRVKGNGPEGYGEAPVIEGFTVREGDFAVELIEAPFATVRDVASIRASGDAFRISSGPDGYGTFGVVFQTCAAWNGGGIGFRAQADASPHGTKLVDCLSTANRGMGAQLRGVNWELRGGSLQLNYGPGLEIRGGQEGSILGTYIEGNNRRDDGEGSVPIEVFCKNHPGLTVFDARFHGINPRTVEHDFDRVERALNVHDSPHLSVAKCSFLRYGDAALALFNCEFADVDAYSHFQYEAELLSSAGMGPADPKLLSGGIPLAKAQEFVEAAAPA